MNQTKSWVGANLMGKSLMRSRIFTYSQSSSRQSTFFFNKEELAILQWMNLADITLGKSSKLTSSVMEQGDSMCPLISHWEGHSITSMILLSKMHYLNGIVSKCESKWNWGTAYKMVCNFLNNVKLMKSKKKANEFL